MVAKGAWPPQLPPEHAPAAQPPETGLDPEDPWAVRVEALADDEEAAAALREKFAAE